MANEDIEKLIEKLKKLSENDLEKNLGDLLKDNKLTPDLLLAECKESLKKHSPMVITNQNGKKNTSKKEPLKINPVILNRLGINFRQGKNDFPKNEKFAIKLYEAAALQNNAQGYYSWAICAFHGYGTKANIELAKKHCLKAIELKHRSGRYFLGTILWEEEKWEEAKHQFLSVPFFNLDKTENRNFSDAQYYLGIYYLEKVAPTNFRDALFYFKRVKNNSDYYEETQERIKKIELLYPAEIKKKFKSVENEKLTKTVSQQHIDDETTFRPLKRKAWHIISPSLHGHDPHEEEKVITEYQLALLNCNTAKSAVDLSKIQEKEASEKKLPKFTLDAIKAECKKAEEKYSEAQGNLREAESNYNEMKEAVSVRRHKRQRKTEETFFSPERSYAKDSMDLCLKLQENRHSESAENVKILNVNQQPTRRLITAEIGVMSAGLDLGGGFDGNKYGSHYGWATGRSLNGSGTHMSYETNYCHTETIALTDKIEFRYQQRNNPHANHPGDYLMFELGEYKNIISFIDTITGSSAEKTNIANEKKLAFYMVRYSRTGQPMVLDELKQLNEEATENDLVDMHRIFYHCCVKEPSRFFLAKNEYHQLPLATVNARALQLLVRGHLSMRDVFSQDAPYGVFTAKNIGDNIDKLKEKINRINEKYEQQILNTNSSHVDNYYAFMRHHPQGSTVPTRQQCRQELQSVYGGSDDSDGEGYDTEDDFTPAPKM